MDTPLYLATWLVVVLAVIAVLSWVLARHRRRQDLRRLQAQRLLQALLARLEHATSVTLRPTAQRRESTYA